MSPLSKALAGVAVLCFAGMAAMTPTSASERIGPALRGAPQAIAWEFSDQRRRYRHRRVAPRRHYYRRHYRRPYVRPFVRGYYQPYYVYPRRYYRPYYRPYYQPLPPPFFPFFF